MTDGKPIVQVNRVRQVCVVVRDMQRAMGKHWTTLGIGPWEICNFEAPNLTDTTMHGNPQPYSMKLGLTEIGPFDHGIGIIQSGNYAGSRYAYLDTEEQLSMIAEIVDWPDDWDRPAPDGVWPPQD